MLTPNSISNINAPKKEDARIKDYMRLFVNTMLIGKATAVSGNMVTVNIFNKKPLNSQIFQNAPGNTDPISGYQFQDIGTITVRFISLAYIVGTPQVDDTVMLIVPQSSIEAFFDGTNNNYGGSFPIAEALVIPINTTYSTQNTLTINPNSDTITNVVLDGNTLTSNAKNIDFECEKFKIYGNGGDIFVKLIIMLTAVGEVAIPGGTIDSSSGGAITTFITFLEQFVTP
jgi:hypothetical protein